MKDEDVYIGDEEGDGTTTAEETRGTPKTNGSSCP